MGAGGVLAIKGVGVIWAARFGGGVRVMLVEGRGIWVGVLVNPGRVGDGVVVPVGEVVVVGVAVTLEVAYFR